MPEVSSCFYCLEKAYDRVSREKLWRVLTAACWWPPSYYISIQNFVPCWRSQCGWWI